MEDENDVFRVVEEARAEEGVDEEPRLGKVDLGEGRPFFPLGSPVPSSAVRDGSDIFDLPSSSSSSSPKSEENSLLADGLLCRSLVEVDGVFSSPTTGAVKLVDFFSAEAGSIDFEREEVGVSFSCSFSASVLPGFTGEGVARTTDP